MALEDVSFDLPAGAFCLLLGANGAGKTTLLQALAGAIRADAGVARFEGAEIGSGIWQRRSNLAYAGHSASAYPLASVEQNLRFARRLGGQPTLPPVGKAIAGFGLCDQADQRAGTLSRGQRQRLELALATVRAPRLLLLDEPFTGLDTQGAEHLRTMLAQRDKNSTVLIATHNPGEVWDLADHVLALANGRLVANRDCAGISLQQAIDLADSAPPPISPTRRDSGRGFEAPDIGRFSPLSAVVAMDLAQVWRGRGSAIALAALSILIMLTVALALQAPTSDSRAAAVGGYWAGLTFAAVLGSHHGFPHLRESGTLTMLLTAPLARPVLALSQMVGQLARLVPVALLGLVAASVLFNVNLVTPDLVVLAIAGAIALSALGAAYGALLSALGSREVLGPLLMLPAALPIIIVGVLSTAAVVDQTMSGTPWQVAALAVAYAALICALLILAIDEVIVE